MGTNKDGGVGGGVASANWESVVEGVLMSRLEVEKCLRGAEQENEQNSDT